MQNGIFHLQMKAKTQRFLLQFKSVPFKLQLMQSVRLKRHIITENETFSYLPVPAISPVLIHLKHDVVGSIAHYKRFLLL